MAAYYKLDMETPLLEFSPKQRDVILYGGKATEEITLSYQNAEGQQRTYNTTFEGIIPHLRRRYEEAVKSNNHQVTTEIGRFMSTRHLPWPVRGIGFDRKPWPSRLSDWASTK